MQIADIPARESDRLKTLRLYRILDTEAEQPFDSLTRLASAICGTPISTITLIDESRQWFKSTAGLDSAETPRDVAFCAHAILTDGVTVVEDARQDARFVDNPLVQSEPRIRFYAGAPLTMPDGMNIGTLCVIDRVPRTLTPQQLDALTILRDAVVARLELRRALGDLDAVNQLLPMCAWCRNIRQADNTWMSPHEYLTAATNVTHSICPDCVRRME